MTVHATLFALAALAIPVAAARPSDPQPPAPDKPFYTLADFPGLPENPTYEFLRPERAVEDEIEGLVTVECVAGDNGRYDRCAIVRETPKGYGFGKATVAYFLGRTDRVPPAGSVIQMTTRWGL